MPENCAAIVIAAKHHELIRVKDTRGTTHTVGALRCKFEFRTNDWLNSAKTAMFCNGDALLHPEVIDSAIAVPLDADDECPVPYEVLTDTLPYSIGVWGVTSSGLRIVSNWLVFGAQVGCYTEGNAPGEPEQTVYEQILQISNDAVNIATSVENRANSGEFDGVDGQDGIGVANAEINTNGELVVTLSNNTVLNLGVVVGAKGDKGEVGATGASGADGISVINSTINSNGELIISYSNGKEVNLGRVIGTKGDKGDKGDTGMPGKDGIDAIASVSINNGELIITYSDGSSDNVGVVVGSDGKDGDKGEKGDSYVLTDTDKQSIAALVENDFEMILDELHAYAQTILGE